MFIKASVLMSLAIAVAARPETPSYSPPAHPAPSYSPPSPSYITPVHPSPSYRAPTYNDVPAQYNTQYAVNDEYSGNNYGHQEDRDGYKTQGTYYVQLPDGRLQKVTYYVDGESGYVAEVTYEGEAQYPAYQPAPSTSYQPAPSPSYA
ncbi:pro-resilin-like isoform X2 [Penaeus chinensis]|uniref:pro-resilin-like isoform X2 n=1 Tax=Penaeus chinensis TaxID=139456 RepID=UPI001FB8404C|nr:pro-resilin-like isoform X2 [Penaeus chinensis]